MKKYIGNIIVKNLNYKVDDCYKKCLSMSEIDKNIPTLIIGLQNAKELIDGFDILKKRYNGDMLWWTFTKSERRIDYEKDLEDFYVFCIRTITNKINYRYINILDLSLSDIKKYKDILSSGSKKIYYIDNNKFLFIYDIYGTKDIYGISLDTCAFFGISKKKILSYILTYNMKEIKNFYMIPNKIRKIINLEIPYEMALIEFFDDF